jgi:hypothetical protein
MDEFLKNASTASWWLSAVVVGVVINLLSAVLLRRLDKAGVTLTGWMRKHSEKKQQAFDEYVAYLVERPERLVAAYARESRWRLRSLYCLGMGVVCYLIFTTTSPSFSDSPTWKSVLTFFLSVIVLFAFKFETVADQTAEASAEAAKQISGHTGEGHTEQSSK